MKVEANRVEFKDIEGMRDIYRQEMNCQIIHDSIHGRPGWTHEYLITTAGVKVGYGSVAVAGPWQANPCVYEFFVLPQYRGRLFDFFLVFLAASCVTQIETQSNDLLLTVLLHAFTATVSSESILFYDKFTTAHSPPNAYFRKACEEDSHQIVQQDLNSEAKWLVAVDGVVAATGDILFHYNRPYGDIYVKVAESFRKRGLGTYLVQELKRVCYESGSVPAARCNPKNVASRQALQKAGFVPCGHILKGAISL
ncbi:GNAT family N-acetyltransferase [Telmatocola sphagniphila]|uniref:GNAT family N-acetyltransferase n=1 Tax=Telmatocola sphagniphila TaxID=1123043 RepID=A0A8E6B977_9BACT|nr:GNAT family N-acetyltransferase [Telmatocola sphagniphila]QVL33471.1 GNAT family N-acetyltransferase [Telmatocola sphagniphila]